MTDDEAFDLMTEEVEAEAEKKACDHWITTEHKQERPWK